ncbi:hypothetical protein [Corynebacterium ciconiae]|nr:hypothetical protein [Corynebacterium ciconiae]
MGWWTHRARLIDATSPEREHQAMVGRYSPLDSAGYDGRYARNTIP